MRLSQAKDFVTGELFVYPFGDSYPGPNSATDVATIGPEEPDGGEDSEGPITADGWTNIGPPTGADQWTGGTTWLAFIGALPASKRFLCKVDGYVKNVTANEEAYFTTKFILQTNGAGAVSLLSAENGSQVAPANSDFFGIGVVGTDVEWVDWTSAVSIVLGEFGFSQFGVFSDNTEASIAWNARIEILPFGGIPE